MERNERETWKSYYQTAWWAVSGILIGPLALILQIQCSATPRCEKTTLWVTRSHLPHSHSPSTHRRRRKGKRRGSNAMSATTAAVPFWRAAGMTYIGYSNICAALVRNCLKEPFKSEVASREKVHFSISKWADGKQEKPSEWSTLSFTRCVHVRRPWLDSTRSAWMLCGTVGS